MSAAFTPGPWIALDTGEVFACETDSIFASDLQICSTVAQDGYEQEQANARLIAAAPKLHALALQYRDDLRHPPEAGSRERRMDAIDAVLAQVGGEQ